MTDEPTAQERRSRAAFAADLPSPGMKMVLLAIAFGADEDGSLEVPTLDDLAARTGLTPRTVRRHISTLVAAGLLEETVRLRVRV